MLKALIVTALLFTQSVAEQLRPQEPTIQKNYIGKNHDFNGFLLTNPLPHPVRITVQCGDWLYEPMYYTVKARSVLLAQIVDQHNVIVRYCEIEDYQVLRKGK